MGITLLRHKCSTSAPCPKTGAARCYCQPKLGVETTRPARTSGDTIRETKENEPGWPVRIGTEGYAQYLLRISNPASVKSEGIHAPPSSTPATSISPSTSSDNVDGEPASANASLYVHTGSGIVARSRCWKGRNTSLLDEDSIGVFSKQPSLVEEERRSFSSNSNGSGELKGIEIVEEGVVVTVVGIFKSGEKENEKDGGKKGVVRKDEGLMVGEKTKGKQDKKLKSEPLWRRVCG